MGLFARAVISSPRNPLPPRQPPPGLVFLLPTLLVTGLLGLPVLALLLRASGAEVLASLGSAATLAALRLSLVTSLASVLIIVLLGTPLAYLLTHWNFPGKAALEVLLDLPVVLPPSVAGLALLVAFGRQGLLGGILNEWGIQVAFTGAAVILAQVFVAAPFYIRSARVGFAAIDPQLEEAARVAGASPWQMFHLVMLPLAWRALTSGAVLSWTRALGEFGATILFAGNLQGVTQTMPLAIYLGFERDLGVALALSALLVLVSAAALVLLRGLETE